MNNADKPAYPSPFAETAQGIHCGDAWGFPQGITKREYFAAKAMGDILSNPETLREFTAACKKENIEHEFPNVIARAGLLYADALIEELEK